MKQAGGQWWRRRCKKLEREKGERVDAMFRQLIPSIKQRLLSTDDNCTVVCFGATGSGKSSLGFHAGNLYNEGEGLSAALVGFDPLTWAQALATAKDQRGAFLMHDEGNFSKRDSMAQKNKDFIDLLFTFRSKNWFLWINNPSADYLDKELLFGDLVNFFVFIHAKQRRYYFIPRKQMQDFYARHQTLRADALKKYGKHYAAYDGWFLRYAGKDWDAYLDKKTARVDDKLMQYIEKYGRGKAYSLQEAARALGVHKNTLLRYVKKHEGEEEVRDLEKIAQHWRFLPRHIEFFRRVIG